MTDLIKRADAIDAVRKKLQDWGSYAFEDYRRGLYEAQDIIEALPSADADGEDLIIKGAKGIQDGLYNITDGKLFKYKAKGGTVRTYPIVPSADAVHGEWVIRENGNKECSVCGHERQDGWDYFCGYCGARMKGGAE